MPPTLDQLRAQHAWYLIDKIKGKKAGAEIKKLPTRILVCGLGPALAFLDAKKDAKNGLGAILDGLSEHVAKRIPPRDGRKSLLERIVLGDAAFLRRATDEALAYLQWLGRFAEARGLVGSED